jgi:hypothetical protein
MYFQDEGYHDAYYAGAVLEELRCRDRQDADRTDEPIRIPATLNWLVVVSFALCVAVTVVSILAERVS